MGDSFRRVVLGAIVLLALKFHLVHLLDPWRINGDVRQHVFWTFRYADPELFPDDPLVRFISSPRFDPPGYVALYALLAPRVDALLVSKLLAALLCLPTGWFAYRTARRLGGDLAGLLAAIGVGFVVFDNLRGGLPRSFAFPLVFAFLDALTARSLLGVGLVFVATVLFYPPLVFSMGALLPLLFLRGWRLELPPLRRVILALGVPLVIAVLILARSYLVADKDFVGPMVTKAEAFAMPEFHQDGRNEFWVEDPVAFWLGDGSYNRSACNLLSEMIGGPLVAALLFGLLRGRRAARPRELVWMVVTSALLFLVAHAVLFRLFLPSRYTQYTWPAAFLLLAALNAAPILERVAGRVLALLRGWPGAVGFVILAAFLVVRGLDVPSKAPSAERMATFDAVSALPKNALVAAWPDDADNLPLRTKRSVLANRELALPYYTNYYALVRARLEDSYRIQFARDRAELLALCRKYGVTHVLVDRGRTAGVRRALPVEPKDARLRRKVIDPPFDRLVEALIRRPGVPLLLGDDHGFRELHRSGTSVLLAVE